MKSIARVLAVWVLLGTAAACGPPPEDGHSDEVSSIKAPIFGSCIGPTPPHYLDTYAGTNFTSQCTRVPPYSQIPNFDTTSYYVLRPSSLRVGPHTIVRYYSGRNFTAGGLSEFPDAPSIQEFPNTTVGPVAPWIANSFAMLPIGYRYDGLGQPGCRSSTVTPGARDMILYNGTYYGGICAVFTGVYPDTFSIPDLAYFGWDPDHYPVASVKLGVGASATAYYNVNFDNGGAPPFAMPTGWSFPQVAPFRSVTWH